MENFQGWLGIVAAVVALFVVFLPIIVVFSASRAALSAAAWTFSALAVTVIAVGISNQTADILVFPAAGFTWFCGLVCGIAAFLDSAAERRAKALLKTHAEASQRPGMPAP